MSLPQNNPHSLSRRRERVRVRVVEYHSHFEYRTDPHPQPFSRLRAKGVKTGTLNQL